ncbi:PREDICTED: THAP domain-containing protein 1-like [Priapulus caudatus]|uniref:THAP domain-containing protein 1-like n=1 Tax=Priapulus caudatus TaxID=37621 RepID=A0ABM1EI99_PRICU|nr:PREDICTED: THAP domain-containing protein 1-like [Priapulus caudatus]
MRRAKYWPKDKSVLCCDHFEPQYFDMTGQTIRLRENAAPTIFTFPKPQTRRNSRMRMVEVEHRLPLADRVCETQQVSKTVAQDTERKADDSKAITTFRGYQRNSDHNYCIACSPKTLKSKLDAAYVTLDTYEKKLKRGQQLNSQLEQRIKSTKSVVRSLREQNVKLKGKKRGKKQRRIQSSPAMTKQ